MTRIKTVTVVGEGKMGTNLFSYLADYPFRLRWLCSPKADVQKLGKTWEKKNQRAWDLGIMNEKEYLRRSEVIISVNPEDSADSDLVIETIPENLLLKQKLFATLDQSIPSDCILASNSSSILPSFLVPSDQRKRTTVGLHFFYPVSLKNLVEFVVAPGTSTETISAVKEFLDKARRFYLFQTEPEAFLINRIFLEFQLEAWQVVRDGLLTMGQADDLVRERFFPIGVFECFDSVGIDVMLPAIENYTRPYPDKEKYSELTGELRRMIDRGMLGVKSGAGFFSYGKNLSGSSSARPESSSGEIGKIVTERLSSSLKDAVRRLSLNSNIPGGSLAFALQEYFGVNDPSIFI